MSKINEYPQAVTINNNDLFVIDQQSGGDHATKSASVSQIKQATRDGLTDNDISHYTGTPTAGTTAEAIGDLSQLTTTDKSSLVGAVNSMMIKTNGAWTANSSSAYGTTLTDSINVTAGVWLITWGHPSQNATLGCFVDGIATNSDITDQFMSLDNGLAYTKSCILVRFTGNSTIKLCSGGSASVSFSDIGRGFLRAIKLK